MALNIKRLGNWGSTMNKFAPQAHLYASSADDIPTITADSYFDTRKAALQVGDIMYVDSASKREMIEITQVTPIVKTRVYKEILGFMAYRDGAVPNVTGNGGNYQIPYNNTSKLDIGKNFNTDTGKLIAPFLSAWHLNGVISLDDIGGPYDTLFVYLKYGATTVTLWQVDIDNMQTLGNIKLPWNANVTLGSLQTAEVSVQVTGGGSGDDIDLTDVWNTFEGHLIKRLP